MAKDTHIYEGWTVQNFIDDLTPVFDMINTGNSYMPAFKTKKEIKDWCASEQLYYKKHIPEVYEHFVQKSGL